MCGPHTQKYSAGLAARAARGLHMPHPYGQRSRPCCGAGAHPACPPAALWVVIGAGGGVEHLKGCQVASLEGCPDRPLHLLCAHVCWVRGRQAQARAAAVVPQVWAKGKPLRGPLGKTSSGSIAWCIGRRVSPTVSKIYLISRPKPMSAPRSCPRTPQLPVPQAAVLQGAQDGLPRLPSSKLAKHAVPILQAIGPMQAPVRHAQPAGCKGGTASRQTAERKPARQGRPPAHSVPLLP